MVNSSIVGTSGNLGLAMRAVHHHLHSQVDFYATCSSITTSATSRNVKRPFDQGLKPLLTSWNPKDCTNSVCWLLSTLMNLVDVDEIKNLLCLDYWLAAFLSQIVSLDYVRSLPKISLPKQTWLSCILHFNGKTPTILRTLTSSSSLADLGKNIFCNNQPGKFC